MAANLRLDHLDPDMKTRSGLRPLVGDDVKDAIAEWMTHYLGLKGWDGNVPSDESADLFAKVLGFESASEWIWSHHHSDDKK